MTDIPTPTGEVAERVRAALAEVGYPHAKVRPEIAPDGSEDAVVTLNGPGAPSGEACWMAFFVADCVWMCWPCWDAGFADTDCTHDPTTSPRPSLRSAPSGDAS